MGIIAVITTVSLVNLVGWQKQKQLSSASQQIATLIREAESRAISQSKGASWGIHFEDGPSGPYYALFYSDTYNATTTVTRYSLPTSLNYNSSTFANGSSTTIIFSQISGAPQVISGGGPRTSLIGNITVGLYLAGQQATSANITLSDTGSVAFDSYTCIITCTQTTIVLAPLPTLVLSADPSTVVKTDDSIISWSSTNSDSCSAASWTNSNATSGSESVTPNQTSIYGMRCTGSGGNVTSSVMIIVTDQNGNPLPGGGGPGGGGPTKYVN